MERRIILQKTPGKTVYSHMGTGRVSHFFTDEYYCPLEKKVLHIPGKGVITNRLSGMLFGQLRAWDIPTHFLSVSNMRTSIMHQAEPFPFSLKLYCAPDPEMVQNLNLGSQSVFSPFLVEYLNTNSVYNLNDEFVMAMGWIEEEELEALVALALRCVHGMQGFFSALGFQLLHIELLFGRDDEGELMVLGTLSPENICLKRQKDHVFMGSGYVRKDPLAQYHLFCESFLEKKDLLRAMIVYPTPSNERASDAAVVSGASSCQSVSSAQEVSSSHDKALEVDLMPQMASNLEINLDPHMVTKAAPDAESNCDV